MPAAASAAQSRSSSRREPATATPRGPTNSSVTATPRGNGRGPGRGRGSSPRSRARRVPRQGSCAGVAPHGRAQQDEHHERGEPDAQEHGAGRTELVEEALGDSGAELDGTMASSTRPVGVIAPAASCSHPELRTADGLLSGGIFEPSVVYVIYAPEPVSYLRSASKFTTGREATTSRRVSSRTPGPRSRRGARSAHSGRPR